MQHRQFSKQTRADMETENFEIIRKVTIESGVIEKMEQTVTAMVELAKKKADEKGFTGAKRDEFVSMIEQATRKEYEEIFSECVAKEYYRQVTNKKSK